MLTQRAVEKSVFPFTELYIYISDIKQMRFYREEFKGKNVGHNHSSSSKNKVEGLPQLIPA